MSNLNIIIMNIVSTKNISFEFVVNMVKENTLKYVDKQSLYTTKLNTSDFQLIKIVDENTVVFFHLPTKSKVRVKIAFPLSPDIPVEIVEIMPEGKKRYTYVADYNLRNFTPSIYEYCYKNPRKSSSFDILLFCSL